MRWVIGFGCWVLGIGVACANPFADTVVSYTVGPGVFANNPLFNDPSRCLGAPRGLYVDEPDNSSLATLGDGGSITLAFNEPVYDHPKNPYGLDFIVFSNAQYVGGNPNHRWQELAYVEISQNGTDWHLILPSKWPQNLVPVTDTGQSYTVVSGYAEYTPTVGLPQDLAIPSFPVARTEEELYTVPERPSVPGDTSLIRFDYVSGGGDALDIAQAVVQSSRGVPALDGNNQPILANLGWFRYVRVTDALIGDSAPGLYDISAEIDAVAAVRPAMSLGEAAKLPTGGCALVADAVVTAAFEGGFFVEAPDRSAAMKAVSSVAVEPGDRLTITGHVSKTGGAVVLPDPMFTITSSGNPLPSPLGMPVRSLATPLAYGLSVRTWGRVTDEGDGYWCTITDGGHSAKVVCADYLGATLGSYVTIDGVCDREEGTGKAIIRLTDPNNSNHINQ